MAKVSFHPIIKWFTGRIGRLILRRSHNGQVSIYEEPDMSQVEWSPAQQDHRQRMSEAWKYASAAIADPEVRQLYVEMALEWEMNPGRPYEVATKDYYHGGEDLLWKKHMGGQPKPENWTIYRYPWYFPDKPKRRSRPARRGKR